jgi:cytochrome c
MAPPLLQHKSNVEYGQCRRWQQAICGTNCLNIVLFFTDSDLLSPIKNFLERIMKRAVLFSILALGMAGSQIAAAADNPMDLAKAKNCLSCHAVATKVVGPAYKDVAAKYAGQKDAEDKLVQKVLKGTSGTWGAIPMPANAQVNEAEAHVLVKWVLSQK